MSETFEKKKRESFSLPPSLMEKLRESAKKADRPLSAEVKRRLEWSFKQDVK